MQVGISPKVKIPSIVLFALGIVLAVAGALLNEDTLTTSAVALVGASGITFGTGYNASAGEVVSFVGEASDSLLSEEVKKGLSEL